jgi:HAD superfamily hydrolase (TIGR01484 family)
MKVRLIAVDLDGTLLGGTTGRYGFLPAGVTALREAASRNIAVSIVTGRDLSYILDLLAREGVDPLAEGWPHLIIAEERYVYYLRKQGYEPDTQWNDAIHEAERSQFERIRNEVSALLTGELAKADATSFRVEGSVEEQRGFVEVRFADAGKARAGELVLSSWLQQSQLSYATVRNVAGVAIRHSSVGKGQLLRKVCVDLDISPAEVVAIGDSSNDLSMLDGGLHLIGAAPGNAEDEVKEAIGLQGGYIADAHYGDGVAEIIKHHI